MSVKQTVGQDPNKITALYERLSRDDDQVGDSNSIVNQKKYLESYAEQKGYTNISTHIRVKAMLLSALPWNPSSICRAALPAVSSMTGDRNLSRLPSAAR